MHIAVEKGNFEIIKLLKSQKGIDLNSKDYILLTIQFNSVQNKN